ncbi:MAG: class I adenylate-forming enzyme family protein [Anaerolineales bacterium]|jgi:acyl-CoA synthetase (AMP-forming)/AMP-acid ligase II
MLNTKMTMMEALDEVVRSRPNQEAVVCGQSRISYRLLRQRIEALFSGLSTLGLSKGDKIVCLLPPGPEFVYLFFATAELGAVFIPLNPLLHTPSLNDVLSDAEPHALVTIKLKDPGDLQKAPNLHHIIQVNPDLDGELSFAQLTSTPASTSLHLSKVEAKDLLALLYTSGTTGAPKGTMHTHSSLIAPVAASIKLRELWMQRPNLKWLGRSLKALTRYRTRLLRAAGHPQTFLSTGGWHTITGLEVMLQGLLMGDRLVVMPRFHPRNAMRLIEAERVTVMVAVPMVYQILLGMESFDQYDTSSLLICGTGAAPCPPELARKIQHHFGCAIHIGFGATETAGGIAATSLDDSDPIQAETVGRPMPGMEIKIVDTSHRNVKPGQIGELACRSSSLMLGYYGDPESTAEVIDDQGWYYTGDLAVIDEEGYVHIVGRKKDVIIRAGQNIYPAEVETHLVSHPHIREAAVVGIPTSVAGETIWAFIIPEKGGEMTPIQVLDHCRSTLEAYKIPNQIRFLKDFPRSETGKPQKFKLREAALRELKETHHGK